MLEVFAKLYNTDLQRVITGRKPLSSVTSFPSSEIYVFYLKLNIDAEALLYFRDMKRAVT